MGMQVYQFRSGALADIPTGQTRRILTVVAESSQSAAAIVAREKAAGNITNATWTEMGYLDENAISILPDPTKDPVASTTLGNIGRDIQVPGLVSEIAVSAQ